MTTITFDPAAFRVLFPTFQTPPSDATLQAWFDLATATISNEDYGCLILTGAARVQALNLMTAHIGTLFDMIASGQTPGYETSATVDKVSVTVQAPPGKSQFIWWLNTTPYGAMLAALLGTVAVGGLYVGGMPERSGFRRVGGGFNGPYGRFGC